MASKLSSLITSYRKPTPKWVCMPSYTCSMSFSTITIHHHHQTPKFCIRQLRECWKSLREDEYERVHSDWSGYWDAMANNRPTVWIYEDGITASHSLPKKIHPKALQYYQDILKLGMAAGNLQQMEHLCHSMLMDRCPDAAEHVFARLLDSFLRAHNFKQALHVLHIYLDVSTNCYFCAAPFYIPGILYDLWRNQRHFGRPQSLNDDFMQFVCDSRIHKVTMGTICEPNKVCECLKVREETERRDLKRHSGVASFNYLLDFLCRANEADKVSQLIRDITASGFNLNMINYVFKDAPTDASEVYMATVNGFCNLWRFDDAANFLHENSLSYSSIHNILLRAYCNAGRFTDANNYLDMMVREKIALICSWGILIDTFRDEGLENMAKEKEDTLYEWILALPQGYDEYESQNLLRMKDETRTFWPCFEIEYSPSDYDV